MPEIVVDVSDADADAVETKTALCAQKKHLELSLARKQLKDDKIMDLMNLMGSIWTMTMMMTKSAEIRKILRGDRAGEKPGEGGRIARWVSRPRPRKIVLAAVREPQP